MVATAKRSTQQSKALPPDPAPKPRARRRPEPVFRGGLSYMTSKGQVTITANLREALRLKPGDRVLMMLQDDGSVQLERLRDVDEIVGSLTNVSVDVRKEWREISAEGQEELAKGALKYMDREQDR